MLQLGRIVAAAAAIAGFQAASAASAADEPLAPCRLKGVPQEIRCGFVEVPEAPDQPAGRKLKIQFAVVPAIAKNKARDPVFVLAGGPGQAAMQVAPLTMPLFADINTRRDIVFVDQRGTGKSHPLSCPDDDKPTDFADNADVQRQIDRVGACIKTLDADTRHYATWIAVRDLDAVRARLGADQVNLWGASYGTRVGLEYLRQFPTRVRTLVIDGVATPDMRLPASFSIDAQRALDSTLAACAADADCKARYPAFAQNVDALVARVAAKPLVVRVTDPLTGKVDDVPLSRETLLSALRTPLYVPTFAAMLPYAVERAAVDDFAPIAGMMAAFAGNGAMRLNWGMHFAVICAEDMQRVTEADRAAATATRFGASFIDLYDKACKQVPHGTAPAGFYTLPTSQVPVLLLSGGVDPVTPPRHAELVAKAMPNSLHLVGPHLGHGVSGQGCAPDLIARFVRQASFDGIDGACLARLPTPRFFKPPEGRPRAAGNDTQGRSAKP